MKPQIKVSWLFIFLLSVIRNIYKIDTLAHGAAITCNETLSVNEIKFLLTCDEITKKEYLRFPERQKKDLEKFYNAISTITNDENIYCKLSTVVKNPNFKIEIADGTSKEFKGMDIGGRYSFYRDILFINKNFLQEYSQMAFQLILLHEFYHGYMSARNREMKTNGVVETSSGKTIVFNLTPEQTFSDFKEYVLKEYGKDSLVYWSGNPCPMQQPREFEQLLIEAQEKLKNLILSLDIIDSRKNGFSKRPFIHGDKNKDYLEKRSQEKIVFSQEVFDRLLTLTHNYFPREVSYPAHPETLKKLIAKKILNKQYEVMKKFELTEPEISIFVESVKIDSKTGKGVFCGFTVPSLISEDRMKAALLDGYYFLRTLRAYMQVGNDLTKELDAHLFDIYILYRDELHQDDFHPGLFEFLFEKIYKYHEELDKPILKHCLAKFWKDTDPQGLTVPKKLLPPSLEL